MIPRHVASVLCSAAALCLLSCAKLPPETVREAKATLEKAIRAGAETYAPSQLKAAQVSYDLALKEIAVENRKLPFMRKYSRVIEALRSTTIAAQSAAVSAEATKKRVRAETEEIVTRAQSQMDSIDAIFSAAVKKKKNIGTLGCDQDTIRAIMAQVDTALAQKDLLLAKEKAVAAQARLSAVMAGVKAIQPPKRNPSKKR